MNGPGPVLCSAVGSCSHCPECPDGKLHESREELGGRDCTGWAGCCQEEVRCQPIPAALRADTLKDIALEVISKL